MIRIDARSGNAAAVAASIHAITEADESVVVRCKLCWHELWGLKIRDIDHIRLALDRHIAREHR